MFQLSILYLLVFALINILFVLIGIAAYYTLSERTIMPAQRRRGPNVVGIWGLLQLFIAGLKALLKEIIIPRKSNKIIFIGALLLTLLLVNTGLDIAVHDKITILLYFSVTYSLEYLKIFWIGLLEGTGSMEVNHWQEKTLQFRITIKLKNTEQNKKMFILLYEALLIGKISIVQKDQFIIWIIDKRTEIEKAVLLMMKYPPLTSKKIGELSFLAQCLKRNNVAWYLKHRTQSFMDGCFQAYLNSQPIDFLDNIAGLNYFEGWLSGFIEAKGNFCVRTTKKNYFSIGHFKDDYLIGTISRYFGAGHIIRKNTEYLLATKINEKEVLVVMYIYAVRIYKKRILVNIFNHFSKYHLLGQKKVQVDWFYSNIRKI